MPTAGIDFDNLSEEELRTLNNIPAMLYHGVKTEEAVLMRMNSVPRSIAERLGSDFKERFQTLDTASAPSLASNYIQRLTSEDWSRLRPNDVAMSGDDYRRVWQKLSGI